ncbi:MAG: VWA domain-containing protein [Methylococcales bacterium]|nr:VWA domain-containing protein [Methylococcales bacterium]
MKQVFFIFILTIVSLQTLAKNDKPLLMANKKNLYQRVLSLPDAQLFPQAKDTQKDIAPLPVFTVYYVYARKNAENNQQWLQVGLGRYGKTEGWIKEEKTLEWSQRLTLTFKDPKAGQDRVLLFKDKLSAEKLATSSNLKEYKKIYQAASSGKEQANSPVVAIQPAENIDIRNNFYLIPIHSYEEFFMKDETARLLLVSSIPLGENDPSPSSVSELKKIIDPPYQQEKPSDTPYAAGITFVIDSTLSMQPYIDRTRKAVKTIYNHIEQANLLGDVSFGLIAFRDNIGITPNIEYVTKQYVSLKQGKNPESFMDQVADLKATNFSSSGFVEDSFAGVHQALQEMEWSPFAARYIVLITDASSRDEKDPLSSSDTSLIKLRELAQKKNVAIFVMHLLTSSGYADHKMAEEQYKSLSEYPGIGDFYYSVPTGSTRDFGKAIESLSTQITAQVDQMKLGNSKETTKEKEQEETQLQSLKSKVEKLGYAFRMKYINKKKGEKAPNVFKAWIVDKDFQNPEKKMVEVRVLLTRNQLSDLHIILKQILDTAEKGVISPKNFLNELKSLAATTSRDPDQLGGTTAITAGEGHSLSEMGFMREYIEGLPYTGEVMTMSLDDWQSWPVKRQIEFLQNLENKINYYQNLHENIDLWVSLKGSSIDGDSVFPIPLDMLP